MKKLVIIGSGGFGKECAEIAKAVQKDKQGLKLIGFLDDNKELHGKIINEIPVLGDLDWKKKTNINEDIHFVVAIGDTVVKKKMVERALKIGYLPYTLIHPSVHISYDVFIGKGTIICPGTIISVNSIIKDYVIINQICSIGHDIRIEDYVTINPLTAISGGVEIEEGVFIGTNSSILQYQKIGEWSIIGAGSCVIKNAREFILVLGVPAVKKLEFRDEKHRERFSMLKFNKK